MYRAMVLALSAVASDATNTSMPTTTQGTGTAPCLTAGGLLRRHSRPDAACPLYAPAWLERWKRHLPM